MNKHIGNPLQIAGVERRMLLGGKGDGMHFLHVRNGLGLNLEISEDRAADISRLEFKGDNMGFFSPCGYVAPQYYDSTGNGFLKSFTAGFFTTCGLTAVGATCEDNGEQLPLHGTISNTPSEITCITETDNDIHIFATVRDCNIFEYKAVLHREYIISKSENKITLIDSVVNDGDCEFPIMLLYHCNMGYPLLSENSDIVIPCNSVTARNEESQKYIDSSLAVEKPQDRFTERCYYYDTIEKNGYAHAGIFNPDINAGVVFEYNKKTLDCFVQ